VGKGNTPYKKCSGALRCQTGAGLLEILAAALIVGLGATGVLQLQTYGLLSAHSASQRQTAFLLLMDLSERVRIVTDEFRDMDQQSLNSESGVSMICSSLTPCSSRQFALHQYSVWRQNAANGLAGADVTIQREQLDDGVFWEVSIGWFADAGQRVTARIGL
jgi:Tfp pilus assembly protein PilV